MSHAPAITCYWPAASDPPLLGPGEIHLWAIALDVPDDTVSSLAKRLDEEESDRANRFLFPQHRRRFVAGRAALRGILADYLQTAPRSIAFGYEGLGKPYLVREHAGALHFNLSNSGEIAVVAISADRPLGVDVEYLPRRCDYPALARRYFSQEEQAALFALPEEFHRASFFRCWTRKEAMLKATGTGLTYPLDKFVVSLGPEEIPRVVSIEGCPDRGREWWLASFSPHGDYEVALAVRGSGADVRCLSWTT